MRNHVKVHLIVAMGFLLLITTWMSPFHLGMGAMDFSLTDNSSDVVKFTLQNGVPTSVQEGVSEGSVDITSISAAFSTAPSQNSTLTIMFSGTPQVDEYHVYWVWFSGTAYMANNNTHYLGILIFVTVTGMTSADVTGAELTLFHGLYSLQDPNAQYPQYFGSSTELVSHSVSSSSLTISFNVTDLTNNNLFVDLWSTVTNIDVNADNPFQTQYSIDTGFMAYAYKTDTANQQYNALSGTFWWDFAPDDESSNFIPVTTETTTSTSPEITESSELTSPENETNFALPTPSFTMMDVITVGVIMGMLGVVTRIVSSWRKKQC